MTTLILHPRYDVDTQLIWQAAVDRGWNIVRMDGWNDPPTCAEGNGPVVLYGGYEWGRRITMELGLPPLISPPETQAVDMPYRLTKRWMKLERLGDYAGFPYPVFVKPLMDKSFAARVYHSAEDLAPAVSSDPMGRVVIQEPVQWFYEWRVFVLDGKALTGSGYARNGELLVTPLPTDVKDIEEHVNGLGISTPHALVVDIGRIKNPAPTDTLDAVSFAVVETNPAWCSGLYDCDPDKALDVIAASCGVRT